MRDDLQPGIGDIEELDGATPRLFRRVFLAAEEGSEARRDSLALAAALVGRPEPVAEPAEADLIVTGSGAGAAPDRVAIDLSGPNALEGATAPVAIATRGLAERDDYKVRRIDVGIEGGRGSAAALATAIRLALSHDARLRLVAVAEIGFELGGAARHADTHEVERLAGHLAHAADGLPGLWVETELREGVADQILVGLAREADLIVLGSRSGYGSAGRVVIGDVVARILRGAPCPVLVVPAP